MDVWDKFRGFRIYSIWCAGLKLMVLKTDPLKTKICNAHTVLMSHHSFAGNKFVLMCRRRIECRLLQVKNSEFDIYHHVQES